MHNIVSFNAIIAETAVACAVITCGIEDVEPPPIQSPQSIEELHEALGIAPEHAPYKDAEKAEYERRLNAKDERIAELESEVERLEKANKAASNSDGNIGMDSDTGATELDESDRLGDFEATFYTASCAGCSGITATGIDVRQSIYSGGKRVVAVDPSVIKLGSIVRVTLGNGDSFDAVAGDVGGAIKGRKLDVLVSTKDEARRLGRQTAKVEFIE